MDAILQLQYENEIDSPWTDSLTGFFHHGFFQILLDHEILRSRRYGTPFTLALVNADGFSTYNDRHGPIMGDRYLKSLGNAIRRNIREVDLAARLSGDVFAVIFTNSDAQSASIAAERIRTSAEGLPGNSPTVSVGLASFPGDATTRHYLIEKAQEALVRAKLGGKNKVVLFEREAPPLDHRPTVLAVDDERLNLEIVEAILAPCNYKIVKTSHPEEALSILQRMDIDLILLDVVMPGMDGYELCRRVKGQEGTRLIPVVLLTGLDDQEAKIKGIEAGADDFVVKPPNHTELIARTNSLIRVKALNHSLIGIENVLFSLARTVEAKDIYTRGHISRTSQLAVLLGKRLGMGRKDIDALRFGAMLHDIGKIGVPMEVLNKPGPLDSGEFEIIRNHPLVGYEICLPLKKTLGKALQVIRHHHEKLDGSGYPDGLRGEEIPFMTRIMAVVDVYDALVTDRPYRKAFAPEKAVAILREDCMRGKLDSQILEELIRALSPPAHAP